MRNLSRSLTLGALAACLALPGFAQAGPDKLDTLYGFLSMPAYIKHYEADKTGKVLINPYLQVATKDYPAILDAKNAPYNWVIDAEGRVGIIQEAAHPLGRTYAKGFFRPEDQSKRKPGTTENYGHVSAIAGGPSRISGEINYDKATKSFTINNKSGRYSKHNPDRTPEQMANAARLIQEVVDPGKTPWGPTYYLLEYAPETVREELMKSPKLAYDDPAKKSRPHIILAAAAAPAPEAEKPKTKAKKAKAAHNDDPS